jgi:hypothetical protein
MNEIEILIKHIEQSEEQKIINKIKKYRDSLFENIKKHNYTESNTNRYMINITYEKISYIYDIKDYLKSLNVIYFEHLAPFGVYCDGLTIYIDKNKLEQFDQYKRNIIVAFYALLPLINIYSIGATGYNGVKGNYEKCTLTLLLKHIGLSNEDKRYAISTRHKQGKINGMEFILPPNHFKLYSLTNFLNNNSPFFEITKKVELYNNPSKAILYITHKALRVNQGESVHFEKANFVVFVDDNNKIIDRKDQDVKDYILSEKILAALMS